MASAKQLLPIMFASSFPYPKYSMTHRLKVNIEAAISDQPSADSLKHGHGWPSSGILRTMSREGRFTLATVVFYGLLAAGCIVWDLLSDGVTLVWWQADTPVWLGLGAALALAVIVFSAISVRRFAWARNLADLLSEALGRPGMAHVVLLAAASSVGEELLFRGCMLQEWGLVVSSLLFGALHGFFLPRYFAWSLFALALGLVWGIMVLACGALVPVIVSHFLVNLVNLRLLGSHQREET